MKDIFEYVKNELSIQPLIRYLEEGGDPNAINQDESLLMAAVKNNRTSFAIKLIEHGADINYAQWNGFSILHEACNRDHREIILMEMMKRDVNVNKQTMFGYTPLMLCRDNLNYIMLLLEQDVDLGLTNHKGQTAFDRINDLYPGRMSTEMLKSAYEDFQLKKVINGESHKPKSLEF